MLFVLAALASTSEGLRFSFERANSASPQTLYLKGEINVGDTRRMIAFLREHPAAFIEHGGDAVLAIDGGDVLEAIEMGQLFRDAMIALQLTDRGRARCVSACFFIYANAVSRIATEGTVGIHRPHIDSASLARSTPAQVRERYAALFSDTAKQLEALPVPRDVIENLLRTAPNETYWLSREELERIGELAPWFDDFSAAKCGTGPALSIRLRKAEAAGYELDAAALREELARARDCVDALRKQQRQKFVDDWARAIKP